MHFGLEINLSEEMIKQIAEAALNKSGENGGDELGSQGAIIQENIPFLREAEIRHIADIIREEMRKIPQKMRKDVQIVIEKNHIWTSSDSLE